MLDETYEMHEAAVQVLLQNIAELDLSTEEGRKALEELMKGMPLVEQLATVDKNVFDCLDKEARRQIDDDRNKAADETERKKQEITWPRVGLELAKVIAPLLVSLIGYGIFQKRVLEFEETGRISSTAGRELHLPKFFK